MAGVLSKLLMSEWSFQYNCYETGHTWTPHCTAAAVEFTFIVLKNAMQMYSSLYLLSFLIARRFDVKAVRQTLMAILTSSTFIGMNAFLCSIVFCSLRYIVGRFYYPLVATVPAFIGSFMAIDIERKCRRPTLAFYVTNIATEALFKTLCSKGHIKPVKRGEVMIFTASVAILLYLVRKNGYGKDPISLALKYIVGVEEGRKQNVNTEKASLTSKFDANSKHWCCTHESSCLQYVANGFFRISTIAWLGSSALSTLMKIQQVVRQPSTIFKILFHPKNIRMGLFLGTFTGVYKAMNCILRWKTNSREAWHGMVAGVVAGPSMLWSPNSTIALYLMWKCIENLCCLKFGKSESKWTEIAVKVLYSVSTAQVFYSAVMEPRNMRPSYMKFLDTISGHKLHSFNRQVLDIFGTNASAGYEEYFPDLDPQFMSRQFKETIFVWMI